MGDLVRAGSGVETIQPQNYIPEQNNINIYHICTYIYIYIHSCILQWLLEIQHGAL